MFQCLGLATEADGGCGEDWWHPECVIGLGRGWAQKLKSEPKSEDVPDGVTAGEEADESALPPGFPNEDDFETFICYKCVDAHPWIRRYAGSIGFFARSVSLGPRHALYPRGIQSSDGSKSKHHDTTNRSEAYAPEVEQTSNGDAPEQEPPLEDKPTASKKRKASEDPEESSSSDTMKSKIDSSENPEPCTYATLPSPLPGQLSLFLRDDFRDHMCRCPKCYPNISAHPQLLEEEESYEPPLSENGDEGNQSAGTGSLYDRGEAALSNVDRVRAIGKFNAHLLTADCR